MYFRYYGRNTKLDWSDGQAEFLIRIAILFIAGCVCFY